MSTRVFTGLHQPFSEYFNHDVYFYTLKAVWFISTLQAYKRMICQTMDLPLEKLILTPEGCDIFDTLCIRIDVNQKYADLLPQWKDLAHQLQIDDLVTKWVETCVRPREGLTRAVMEIYMKDGGTLGEVLEALLHLELLQILEETRPGLEKYIRMKVRMADPYV